MLECRVCGAPAEEQGRAFGLDGVNFDGKDCIVWYQRVQCAAGHWYQVEIYEEEL